MDKVVMGAMVLFGCMVLGVIYAIAHDHSVRAAIVEEYQSKCKIIGDAQDEADGGGNRTRTIYQCPDGMIHIM